MPDHPIQRVRFSADRCGADAIVGDPAILKLIENVGCDAASPSARKELLAHAIRVDAEILPDIHQTIDAIRTRTGIQDDLEFFVHPSPMIEAGAFRGAKRYFILLSSASIEKLSPEELEFVVGHELSHVVYDHFRIPTGKLIQSDAEIEPKQAMRLLSWQRKAEISADRAGLLCCGSLDVAASAFFKTLSGLSIPGMKVNPARLADQFDSLREELWQVGAEDMWILTHPLVPLRMKSLNIFWNSERAKQLIAGAPGGGSDDRSDREIAKLLSYMEAGSQRDDADVDPLLLPFLTWGGLYIAASNRVIEKSELRALAGLIGERELEAALRGPRKLSHFRAQFSESKKKRRNPLSALDINRIFTSLLTVVRADGSVDAQEIEAMHDLARELGIAGSYVDMLLEEL